MKEMDYSILAREFIQNMQAVRTAGQRDSFEGFKGEIFILHFIKESQGKTVPGSISDAIGVSSARVATALNSLEEKEMITRRIDSDDRRRIIVELTPKGMDYAEECQRDHFGKIENLLMLLGEEDAKELVRIVGRVAGVLSKDPDQRGR